MKDLRQSWQENAFLEGDSLHSKENVEKMRHGIPGTRRNTWTEFENAFQHHGSDEIKVVLEWSGDRDDYVPEEGRILIRGQGGRVRIGFVVEGTRHPKANKGEVITVLSGMLHVPAANIATIGDMPNDVLMRAIAPWPPRGP